MPRGTIQSTFRQFWLYFWNLDKSAKEMYNRL